MGVTSAVFESAGKRSEHYVPGVYSRSNNVSSPSGVSANNFVIMGECVGGKPNTLLSFGSYDEAKSELKSGSLLKAIGYAFNGSPDFTPSKILAMRVGAATQASLTISPFTIKSKDYGLNANQIFVGIADGTNEGKKVTVKYQDNESVTDDIIRSSIKVTLTTASTIKVTKTGITVGSTEYKFESYPTLLSLASAIGTVTGITAEVTGNDDDPSDELDVLEYASAKTFVITSTVQAVKEVLEANDYIGDVTLGDSGRTVITNTEKYLSGGTATAADTEAWNTALTALSLEDVQIISTPVYDSAIHALISAHCTLMSNVVNRKERTCILGANIGVEDTAAIANAKTLNSTLASYVIDSGYATDPDTGKVTQIPGATIACILGAMESSMAINNPLTFKELNLVDVGTKRTMSQMENLIKGGVITIQPNPTNSSQIVCIRAVTTTKKTDLASCERSMVREALYMDRDLRSKFAGGIGGTSDIGTSEILQTLYDAAKEWLAQGLIIQSDQAKNVWNITVKKSGDKLYLSYARYLTAPMNFIFITASNHVYESTTVI